MLLAAPAYWFALSPSTYGLLAVCLALAGLSDLLDGTLARRFSSDSQRRFGAGLDPVVDGIFFGSVAFGLALGGAYPLWLAFVVLLRYFVPVVAGGVLLASGRIARLQHTFFGQLSTAVIAVLLGSLALLRFFGQPSSSVVLVASVAVPLLTLMAWVDLGRAAVDLRRPR